MKKILIVAPAWVGDGVMAQPLYRRLLERNPGALIDVLAPQWTLPLLHRMREVNQAIVNPFAHGQLRLKDRFALGRTLAKAGYDQAIVLPNSLKSALIPWFAGIGQRTGFVGEMRYGLLNDARVVDPVALPLMVDRFTILAEPSGKSLVRPVPPPHMAVSLDQARSVAQALGLSLDRPVVVLCPGAEFGPAKRWPARYFAELALKLKARGDQVLVLGSAKDAGIGAEIASASQGAARNLCGITKLDEAIDLMALAQIAVTNDSGLMHVAAALGVPVVAIYGSSSPGFTPPLTDQARIVSLNLDCSPCFKRECPLGHMNCLNQLMPATVLAAHDSLRESQRPRR